MRLSPVPPGGSVPLTPEAARLPNDAEIRKEDLKGRLDELTARLNELQIALYAEGRRALLVVLQGRDTSGKDGAIRRVFGGLNPQGLTVTAFKVPTPVELSHDFLWRAHLAAPRRGTIGVFNRSHYEDVLVVRVKQLVPESVWRPRFEQINQFERILVENGTTILKFYLHISREEQKERLLARLSAPEKYWKFNPGDLEDRALWDQFTVAAEEMLARTSTDVAPWFVVPADRKPVRDVLVAEEVVAALERMGPRFPDPPADLEALRRAVRES
jgi:PPK2 family polyphosphate:nucleotide phosphotransferase